MIDQANDADSGASLDERQLRVERAAEVLTAARRQSEQILHDAERLALDVLNTGVPGELPSDRLVEALGELVAHLRRFFISWQDERAELREELKAIRSLLTHDSEASPADLHLVAGAAEAAPSGESPPPIPIAARHGADATAKKSRKRARSS